MSLDYFTTDNKYCNTRIMDSIKEKKAQLLAEASIGTPESYFELGWCCFMLKEYDEAISWYEKASFTDDTYISIAAMENIGDIYLCSEFSGANEELGISWYKKGALKGGYNAQMSLGHYYKEKSNYAMAFFWYMKAVMDGDQEEQSWALYEVGMLHQKLHNREEARSCFEKSSKLGDSESSFQLANYMGIDEIIEKMQIYENLAHYEDHRGSMIKLAQIYELGLGEDNCIVERNIDEAIYWYKKAANLKNEVSAKQCLAKLLKREKHNYYEAEQLIRQANQIEKEMKRSKSEIAK